MAKIPVVFTFDKRIVLGAAVAIKSLIDCAKDETTYEIFVYHCDVTDKTIKEFEKILENTRHSINFTYISKEKFKDAPINKRGSWQEIVYYRLLIPELLPQYDKVIYSDVDVLFKGDLGEIYEQDLHDFECAMVPAEKNSENMLGHKFFPENKNKLTYMSGFILFNCKKMREEKFVEKFYKTIETFNNRLKFFDLDVINITCNKIQNLPFRYSVLQSIYYGDNFAQAPEYKFLKEVYSDSDLKREKENTIIIHYAGKPGKPWRFKNVPADYKCYIEKIPKSLNKLTFRDFRKRLFSKV